MSKFNVGDKAKYIGKDHREMPEFYPKIGTIGTVVKEGGDTDWYIQWPKGSTSKEDCWYCDENDIELVENVDMTNEEIWEMLENKMRKNGLKKKMGALYCDNNLTNGYWVYTPNDVHNAIAIAYRSGYERAMKSRPFKFGEKKKKKKGGHWEPVDPENLPKEGIRVRYKGGIKKCNWEKNKKGIWVTNETDRFVIRFNDVDWSIWCMNELLKYFDMWVEDDE